jgi:uncharacterized protein YlzI (FlbEa/FlbD family)
VITLHRLGHTPEPFALNPDLIATIDEAHDTHIMLTTGVKLAVVESTEEVVAAIRDWRVLILTRSLEGVPSMVRHL